MRSPLRSYVDGWKTVSPFIERPGAIVVIGAMAFVSALSEGAVLVLLTLSATALVQGAGAVQFHGHGISRGLGLTMAGGLLLVRTAAAVISAVVTDRLASSVMTRTRRRLLAAYLAAAWPARQERGVGDLQEIAGNHVEQTTVLAVVYSGLLSAVLTVLAFSVASIIVSPGTAVLMVVIGGVLMVAVRPLSLRTKKLLASYARYSKGVAVEVTETVLLARDIEVFNVADQVLESLDRRGSVAASVYGRARRYVALTPQAFQIVVLALAVGGMALVNGVATKGSIGSIGAVVLLLLRVASSAQQVVTNSQALQERLPYAESVSSTIKRFDGERRQLGHTAVSTIDELVIDNVGFRFGEKVVLRGVSLVLGKGTAVGVVGPSGAGKSTLVQLVLRLRSPDQGTITVGGIDSSSVHDADWSRLVAFVPQEPVLLNGTVIENVCFFREIERAAAIEALRDAHVLEEMEAMVDGVDTVLGQGVNVSGGQRQRIALARALAGSPELIVLDEPTAALDPISERRIQATLQDLHHRVGLMIVAHRHSTISFCDQILILEKGRPAALATPEELKNERSGYFAEAFLDVDSGSVSERSGDPTEEIF